MRIFVAYGYRDRNLWIPRLIYPIIRAFGDEPLGGENLPGEIITEGVRARIRQADALIGFVTRLGDAGADLSATHRWVTDELAGAHAQKKLILEVRETGVDEQRGIIGDRQPILYEEARRDECLVHIVTAIGEWHRRSSVDLKLLPAECAEQISPRLNNPRLRCTYKILEDGEERGPFEAPIRRITGGLFVRAKNVPRQALVQLTVECDGLYWSSDFESTGSLGIHLRQD